MRSRAQNWRRRRRDKLTSLCVAIALVASGACSNAPFRSAEPATTPAPVVTERNELTPRELLSARLVNPPDSENSQPITVGKLIEFADRYLSCDCSGTRFVKFWERVGDDYRLTTNSDFVRPLHFACQRDETRFDCFLAEIDRGPQSAGLQERFVPGSSFIRFMYEHGVKCERTEPCANDEQSP